MAMSRFLYPRTVSIRRPITTNSGGLQSGYSGDQAANETPIASNLPASIQASSSFRATSSDALPGAQPGPGRWMIFIPRSALAKGSVIEDDTVVDDEDVRYQVADPYWNSLGYRLQCIRLKAH